MSKDVLGDYIKSRFEAPETGRKFLSTLPVYARIDGRGFSKFTRGMRRPYDERMSRAMIETVKYLVSETHAAIGYTQSDEISLVWHAPDPNSMVFFDGKIQKLCSVLASMATAAFTRAVLKSGDPEFIAYADRLPHFDARVFQLPDRASAVKCLHWRELDAAKNAVSMAAHHHFGHKATLGLSSAEKQEKLFQEAGVNFNDYPAFFKRGTFVRRETVERTLTEAERMRIPANRRPAADHVFERTQMVEVDMPIFGKIANAVDVVFEKAEPVLYQPKLVVDAA